MQLFEYNDKVTSISFPSMDFMSEWLCICGMGVCSRFTCTVRVVEDVALTKKLNKYLLVRCDIIMFHIYYLKMNISNWTLLFVP